MRKTTRLLSMLAALAMSAATVTSLTSNAIAIIVTENEVITKYIIDENIKKLGFNYYTKFNDNGETGGLYSIEFSSDGNVGWISPVEIKFNLISVADDNYESFSEYMKLNYPDYELEFYLSYPEGTNNNETIYKITNYDFNLSYEEKYQQALDIKINTGVGYISYIYTDSSSFEYQVLGDLSSDNALTPVDASMLLSYYSDAQSGVTVASAESGAGYSIIGDFNGDGVVTPSDASEILSYYADQQTGQ